MFFRRSKIYEFDFIIIIYHKAIMPKKELKKFQLIMKNINHMVTY